MWALLRRVFLQTPALLIGPRSPLDAPPTPLSIRASDPRATRPLHRHSRAAGVSAAELSLERRVSGLSRALRGLADFGLPLHDELHDALFPDGIERRPRGRAQIPAWRLLADRLTAHLAHPAAVPLASDLAQLSADLVAWCDQSAHRDDALRDARATTVTARDAAEALREALARLDLEVERAAGGTRSPTYASWAAVAGQLG